MFNFGISGHAAPKYRLTMKVVIRRTMAATRINNMIN